MDQICLLNLNCKTGFSASKNYLKKFLSSRKTENILAKIKFCGLETF